MSEPEDDRLAGRVADAYGRPAPLDPTARERLDRAIEREPAPRRRRAPAWPAAPWNLNPVVAVAGLMAALGGGILIGRLVKPPAPAAPVSERPATPVADESGRAVEFVLVAPHASSVAVVGDFNDWDAGATPMRRAPDGESWTVTVPVREGLHAYAFVVDGTRWMADPVAPLAPGDGFGFRNSILVVGGRG